ncbi:hypothetical protein ARSEF1564_007454 [Beauveria bassiana]
MTPQEEACNCYLSSVPLALLSMNLFARPELCPKLSKQRGSLPDAAFDELLKGRLVRDTWADPLPNEHTTAGQVSASP